MTAYEINHATHEQLEPRGSDYLALTASLIDYDDDFSDLLDLQLTDQPPTDRRIDDIPF